MKKTENKILIDGQSCQLSFDGKQVFYNQAWSYGG